MSGAASACEADGRGCTGAIGSRHRRCSTLLRSPPHVHRRFAAQQPVVAPSHLQKLAHTYSIVAYDSVTGDLGVAVQSKFPNVGGIVPWGRAGVGAVATQSLATPPTASGGST